jgi:hypothetical protein
MKPRNIFILLWIFFIAISCSTSNSVKVNYDYDPEVNFTAFKSYAWLPVPAENDKYELIVKQLKNEINTHLKDLGIEKVYRNPDFLIALHGGIQSWLDFKDWEYLHDNFETYAQKRRHDFAKHFDDTVIIDFIDLKTRTLVYRATATVYISIDSTNEERQQKIKAAVARIIDTYVQVLNNES